ncbi:MAG: hypothetical protein WAQ29_07505 [Nitrososphaeraceae archaeon]
MNNQTSFAVFTATLAILAAMTTLQTAYAWSLYVDLNRSAFDIRIATVEIIGPFGYSDMQTVNTGPNTTVNFTIPENAVPYGHP